MVFRRLWDLFYKTCGAFPENNWISILVAFTMIVVGSLASSEVQAKVLIQTNSMHPFAYITSNSQVLTIHSFHKCLQGCYNLQHSGMSKICYRRGLDRDVEIQPLSLVLDKEVMSDSIQSRLVSSILPIF